MSIESEKMPPQKAQNNAGKKSFRGVLRFATVTLVFLLAFFAMTTSYSKKISLKTACNSGGSQASQMTEDKTRGLSFVIIANADEPSAQAVSAGSSSSADTSSQATINSNVDIPLPSGQLTRGSYFFLSDSSKVYNVLWKVSQLKCQGDNIDSVVFSSQSGGFANFNYFSVAPQIQKDIYSYDKRYVISGQNYNDLKNYSFLSDMKSFVDPLKTQAATVYGFNEAEVVQNYIDERAKDFPAYFSLDLLNSMSGSTTEEKLLSLGDYYENKYYDIVKNIVGGDVLNEINSNPYIASGYQEVDANGTVSHNVKEFNPSLGVHYEFSVGYYSNKSNIDNVPWEDGNTVTVKAGQAVNYCPSLSVFKALTADVPLDFSQFPHDIITVTVTFTNGQTLTKKIDTSFNSDGVLCAKLMDH